VNQDERYFSFLRISRVERTNRELDMKILPERPNLQYLSREAKAIKSSHRNGDNSVCAVIGHFDTCLHGLSNQEIFDTRFSILDAQRVLARQYGFSSWSRLSKFVRRCEKGRNPSDSQLRNTVLERREALEVLVREYKSKKGDYKDKLRQYQELSLESTQFLDRAFLQHGGWPGPEVVGADCVHSLAFVAGSATFDADFQNRSTKLMAEALPEGGICAHWQANLRDRYLVLSEKPTVFGSFFGAYWEDDGTFKLVDYDVVDPDNLEKRRARVGYVSVKAERSKLEKEAVEAGWKRQTYEQCMADFRNTSIKGGYQQQ